jgi:chromosome segregation ATPase
MNNLDQAKHNLKSVLNRFESTIEKLSKESKGEIASEVANRINKLTEENKKLNSDLKDKIEEIEYLREQNHKLQAKVGQEQQTLFDLKSKNNEAAERVNSIIGEVRGYLSQYN